MSRQKITHMQYMDESRALRFKRFIFFNIKYITYGLWILAFISLPYIALKLLPEFAHILKNWKINIEEGPLQVGLAMSLFAAVIATLLGRAWIPNFQRWVCQRTLPVNAQMKERHLSQCELYDEAIRIRIKGILPEDLRLPWIERSTGNQFLIPVRAEELASTETKRPPAGRIGELLRFLDLEFFFNVKGRLQPITIQGEPGSGKSTLIFELYRQQANRFYERKQGWIPVFVFAHELSWDMLSQQNSLRSLLMAYFNKCFEEYRHEGYEAISQLLRDHYDEYQFIVIVDGLDEIANRPLYEGMTRRLNELLENEWSGRTGRSNANRYIVSCRTDDNQHTITSRLISLLPLDHQAVMAHLKLLRSAYRKASNPKEQQIRNIIRGLETSKANRLLQNYILNPYLLSLIREYYQEQDNPPARTLAEVFAQVLHRELRKPRHHFEKEPEKEARAHLLRYLSSLLAPYCYLRMIETLVASRTDEEDFSRYIKEDESFARILFGDNGHMGYLQGVYDNDSLVRENRIRELTKLWGDEKTTQFRDFLTDIKGSSETLEAFIDKAVKYLHQDVLDLLKVCGLAEIDESTGAIKRFRHRRMQDYFMALFVDKIGIVEKGRAVIPLGNAWMREPIRILAAISSKPEELLSAFHEEYQTLRQAGPNLDSRHLSKLTDLMVNASEAIAYLPRPQHEDSDQPLHRLVANLGLEAQRLYFLASQKTEGTERRGWLDLLEKCLEILRNIYASEYLRADESIFNSSYLQINKTKVNSWKALHEEIQWEPDSYQHMAYGYLYPIRLSQIHFPLSGGALFFYVIDAVLCFPAAYERLVRETHPKRRNRVIIWLGSVLESISSLALLGFIFVLAWNPVDASQTIEFRLFKVGMVIGLGFICSWGAQIFGLMHWSDFHHAPNWVLLKLGKRCFLIGKILFPILVTVPFKLTLFFARNFIPFTLKAIRFIWRDLFPFLGELIQEALEVLIMLGRKITRNPKPLLLLCALIITLGALWIYALPAATYAVGAWDYSSRVDGFTKSVNKVDSSYSAYRDEIEQLGSASDSHADLEKQKSLMSALDQENKEIVELIGQGQSLVDTGKKYPSHWREDVIRQTEKLKVRKADVGRLQKVLVNEGEIIQREIRFQAFKNNFAQVDAEITRLFAASRNRPPPSYSQSEMDQINDSLTRIDDLRRESESLRSYDQRKSEIASLTKQIEEKKRELEGLASNLPEESRRVGKNVTGNVTTVLTERTSQLLDRTTLTDLGPKLVMVDDFLKSGEHNLGLIRFRLSNPSNWWPPAFYENYELKEDSKYLAQIQHIDSSLPVMRQQLADYELDINSHLDNMKEARQVGEGSKRLEDRTLAIKRYEGQLERYSVLRPKLQIDELQSKLLMTQQENGRQLSKQRDRLLYILLVSPVLLLGLIVARRYGDKTGERRLRGITGDFYGLLYFVRNNRYSLSVNVHAIGYLRKTAPTSYESLRRISEAADDRLGRPGEVNERIGYLLRDVAKGMDNILNRQSL